MYQKNPSPQTALVVLLGASQWPLFPDFQSSEAFANSARQLKTYLLNPRQFGLPAENILDLFDADQSADDIDSAICDFLDLRTAKMKASGNTARDLLVYYVGHGGFFGSQLDYYLAIRRTRSNNPRASSIGIASLADTLKEKARRLRRLVILDCCFAAASFQSFQSGPGQVAIQQSVDAFKEKSEAVGYPERGTALLCSSGPKVPSLISRDGHYTMFTEALLRALTTGNPRLNKTYLSLRELNALTTDLLVDSFELNAPRPHLHSPDQSEGDVADVPFFPNLITRITENTSISIEASSAHIIKQVDHPERLKSSAPPPVQPNMKLLPSTQPIVLETHSFATRCLAWSPDGNFVACGLVTSAQIWNSTQGKCTLTYGKHSHVITAIAWSPDGKFITSAAWDRTVQIWNPVTGDRIVTYSTQGRFLNDVDWSPDSRRIAIGIESIVVVRDTSTDEVLLILRPSTTISAVAWSPDGKFIAAASWYGNVHLWNAYTGERVVSYKRYGPFTSMDIAWSPNSQEIAISFSNMVQIRDISTDKVRLTFCDHTKEVKAVTWSPDGKFIASASEDGTVRVGSAATGSHIATYQAEKRRQVEDVVWAPDSKRIAFCSKGRLYITAIP